jgi:hypothetical protein
MLELRGVVLQSDAVSVVGEWIIRPVETLDLHLAGLGRFPDAPALATHAGSTSYSRMVESSSLNNFSVIRAKTFSTD